MAGWSLYRSLVKLLSPREENDTPAGEVDNNFVALTNDILDNCERKANKDQPNGYPGLDSTGAMDAKIKLQVLTNTDLSTLVLDNGEVVMDENHLLRKGDGVTAGGITEAGALITTVSNPAGVSFTLTHDQADILIINLYQLNTAKTYLATSGVGLQAGIRIGQKLKILMNMTYEADDNVSSFGRTSITLAGTNYQFNDMTLGAFTPSRTFGTPLASDIGIWTASALVEFMWNGAKWVEQTTFASSSCKNNTHGVVAGEWTQSCINGIAVGETVVLGGTYNAGFGKGYTTTGGVGNLFAGEGHTFPTGTFSYNIIGGQLIKLTSTISNGMAFGYRPALRVQGGMVAGSPNQVNQGCAQWGTYNLAARTTSATATIMSCNLLPASSNNALVIPAQSCIAFRYMVTVTDNAGNTGAFIGFGSIKRDNANNTTLKSHTQTAADVDAGLSGIVLTVSANDTNERLDFTVTGLASTTLQWHGRIETSEASTLGQ